MDSNKMGFDHKVYSSEADLKPEFRKLIALAVSQLDKAYAPYSSFLVGAALLLDDGTTYVGCNQENASFPLCMCAERVALYSLGADQSKFNIQAIAITAKNLKKEHKGYCMPCGACRQVIQEFEQRQGGPITLLLAGEAGKVMQIEGIDKILPLSFSIDDLL